MRTLKKTLALVLVVAMLLSFGVTASAAGIVDETFTDAEDIQNELAVNTMVALGVINGMGDGTYAPEGTLTRAQAAKMICYMLGLDKYIEKCPTPFLDVPEAFWASGYIAYCADNNIIAGYGDGNFGPNDELTGYAWAKMLLCAFPGITRNDKTDIPLTWNAEKGEWNPSLTGAAWQINVAKLAVGAGLWEGDDNSQKNPVSRDFAALHAFNVMAKTGFMGYTLNAEQPTYNVYGAPNGLEWTLTKAATATDEAVEIVLMTEEIAPALSFTNDAADEDLEEALGLKAGEYELVNMEGNAVVFEDVTANGTLVELYDAEDDEPADGEEAVDKYVVIVVETYFDYTVAITEATEEDAAYITVDAHTGEKLDYETDAVVEGDVVAYTIGVNEDGETIVASLKVLTAVEGKVTAKAATYVKVDGATKYVAANGLTAIDAAIMAVSNLTAKNFYYDDYGYIAYAAEITPDDGEDEDDTPVYYYGYMTDYAQQAYVPGDAGNLLGGATAAKEAAEKFEIVTAEGKAVIFDGAVTVDEDTNATTFINAAYSVTTEGDETTVAGDTGLVKYTLDENGKIDSIEIDATARGKAYTTGNATLGTDGTGIMFTADTIAFVVDAVKETVTVYTGYQTIPSFGKNGVTASIAANSEFIAIAIDASKLVEAGEEEADPTAAVAFFADAVAETTTIVVPGEDGAEDSETTIYVYENVYVDGKLTTLTFETAAVTEAGLYNITTDEDGISAVVSAIDAVEATVTNVAATYFKATSVYYTTADTAYYVIGEQNVLTVADGITATDAEVETVATKYIVLVATGDNTGKVAAVYYTVTPVEAEA